jgi:flagellar biosynthetic protein FliR
VLTFTSAELNFWVAALLLPMTRILALFAASPVFSSTAIPAPVKIGLSVSLTALVVPALPHAANVPELFGLAGIAAVAKEMLVGLSLGFAVRIIFAAIEFAGEIAAQMMGMSFASLFDPRLQAHTTAISQLYGQVAVVVFLGLNFHHVVITALIGSFSSPAEALLSGPLSPKTLVLLGADIFSVGLHIALPAIATLSLTNMALALLGRAVPQINIFGVGFPVTFGAGFLALIATTPHLVNAITAQLERIGTYLSAVL